jgi:hypothetical protein
MSIQDLVTCKIVFWGFLINIFSKLHDSELHTQSFEVLTHFILKASFFIENSMQCSAEPAVKWL